MISRRSRSRRPKTWTGCSQVFEAHNIRYFFYIGGNDSQDTSHKIHEEAVKRNYALRVIGVPKTIDNDLPHTDNCPGYGSVIKYNATTVMEVGMDVGGMATDDGSCCIIEVMGRSAGWIAAGTVLAKRGNPANPPHIILLPEIQYDVDAVPGQGQGDGRGLQILRGGGRRRHQEQAGRGDRRGQGPPGCVWPPGAGRRGGDASRSIVQGKLNTKTRTVLLGYAQRAAAHCASLTDATNAFACGEAAVRAAVAGESG